MSDYIAELERELIRVGRERQARRARFGLAWRGREPRAGALATVLGVTVAIVVAAAAVVLVGHSGSRAQSSATGRVPPAAQELVSMLAVLRRPQTSADRALPAGLVAAQTRAGRAIVPSLTRLLETVPNAGASFAGRATPRIRLYLIVTTHGTAVTPAGYPGDLVSIASVSAARSAVGFAVSPGIPAALLRATPALRPVSGYNAEIVPDGVVRVRWSFHEGSEYVAVRHNVAVASSLRIRKVPNGNPIITILDRKSLERVTWYGPHGHVITAFRYGTLHPYATGKLVAQLSLQPPSTTKAHTAGVVDVYQSDRGRAIKVTAAGLAANTRRNAYAVWLYRSPSHSKLLGFVSPRVRPNGRLSTAGDLPPDAQSYGLILITLETQPSPKMPGKIMLEARLRFG